MNQKTNMDSNINKDINNSNNTKEKILNAATGLFANLGYRDATVRLIAEKADVNIASISFHFGGKEGLYKAVIARAMETIDDYFKVFSSKVNNYIAGNTYPEQSWAYIEEFIDLLLNIVKDPDNFPVLSLLNHEQVMPNDGQYPLTKIVYEKSEQILVSLMKTIVPNANCRRLRLYSRLVIGGLISQSETPLLFKWSLDMDAEENFENRIWEEIKAITIINIKSTLLLLGREDSEDNEDL